MRRFLKLYLLSLALASILILPGASLIRAAADDQGNLQTCNPTEKLEDCQKRLLGQAGGGVSGYGTNANITEQTLAEKVGRVIGMVLSVFGVVFFGLVVYSGIQWMTAGGNEEKVTHARERIVRAAIGLGIVMMAYALTSFIVSRMQITTPGEVINCSDLENQLECQDQSLYCYWDSSSNQCTDAGALNGCELANGHCVYDIDGADGCALEDRLDTDLARSCTDFPPEYNGHNMQISCCKN